MTPRLPELVGAAVVLVPAGPPHIPHLTRIRGTGEVLLRWARQGDDPPWDEDAVPFAILLEDRVIGMIQYSEEDDPQYRHAGIDLYLDPDVHSRGLGRDAVATMGRHLIHDRGHHRLVIDPAADNIAAIRCYAAAGFRPVGVMRHYERDADGTGWHDGLLMDLLASELPPVVTGPTP